jgi:hypothetical protein
MRGSYDLRRDDAYVRSLLHDRRYDPARDRFAAALTEAEVNEIDEASDIERNESDRATIDTYGRTAGTGSYAGRYNEGGFENVGFKIAGEAHLTALRTQVSAPEKLRLFTATYSLLELEAIATELDRSWDVLKQLGYEITFVEDDIKSNRLNVGLVSVTDAARKFFAERWGSAVHLVESDVEFVPGGDENPRPSRGRAGIQAMSGGLSIFPSPSHTPSFCTSAFTAQIVDQANREYERLYFTAGHCLYNYDAWYQGWWGYGTGRRLGGSYVAHVGDSTDAALMRMPDGVTARVYITSTVKQPITRIQNQRDDERGDPVCFSGANTGVRCGRLRGTTARVYIQTANGRRRLDNQRSMDRTCSPGDSGSPAYNGYLAKGIVSSVAKKAGICFYTHIAIAAQQLSIDAQQGG